MGKSSGPMKLMGLELPDSERTENPNGGKNVSIPLPIELQPKMKLSKTL